MEPKDAAATFVVQDGFQMQLVAAEPLVTDPVAMTIDEDGRAYVVEMNDYPYTDPKTHRPWADNTTDAPIGRVRLLEDTDGDGVYDRGRVFAEGLSWPSGVLCYRGGIFVTATPDIWYLKDADGDGHAEVRERVFTGFRKYNVQAVMNNPIWGLDNHIYVAGSSNGGSVVAPGQTEQRPITARGDFRIDPRTHAFELQAGGARFGNTFDDWGNRFLCNIRNPAIHVVLDNRYLARNPFFAAPTAAVDIAESGDQMPVYRISPLEPWRDLRGKQWSADPTKKLPRSELTGGGVFTSTSGITAYRGHAYPEAYAGQLFEGEVANNAIYRQRIEPDGNTFRAWRADEKAEFVASTDTWFRPVNLYNAPDGTLYVLDMYREFIEHPWSIPDDIHARLDLTSGRDRGRIYRLAPPGFKPSGKRPALSRASTAELVEHLADRDSWCRETAQRLLVERADRSAAPELRKLLAAPQPLPAVHALWTLVGLDAIADEDLATALEHPSPRVREYAVRIAEARFEANPALLKQTLQLSQDDDSRVRLQVALSIGGLSNAAVVSALARLASRDVDDRWMRTAVCSAPSEHAGPLALALLGDEAFLEKSAAPELLEQLAAIIGAQGNSAAAVQLVRVSDRMAGTHDAASLALWQGLGSGAKRKGRSLEQLFSADATPKQSAIAAFLARCQALALDENQGEAERSKAIACLAYGSYHETADELARLIEPLQPQAVQLAAVRALGSYKEPEIAGQLIARLRQLSPAVQDEAFTALLARPERTIVLLRAIENKAVPAGLLGLARKTQLLSSKNASVAELAGQVLGRAEEARAEVVKRYQSALSAAGNPQRGREVFAKHCAACHRAEGLGTEIGPHMETVRSWDRAKLLLNILDPSREVAPQAMSYTVLLADGRAISGLVADETASSVTIKRPGAQPEVVLRQDIEQMSNSGLSLMPVGFEESITPEAMADLLAFLQSPAGK
ncbi:MAG: PVC-type heme-binding CxxCH protein [Aureliella sp.]